MFSLFLSLLCQVALGTGLQVDLDCPSQETNGALDFEIVAPDTLTDYESFQISVIPENLRRDETFEVLVDDPNSAINWLRITADGISGRAPFTYEDTDLDFSVTVMSSKGRSVTKAVSIAVKFNNVSEKFNTADGVLDFNPDEDIQQSLQNENYAVWDIMPMVRGESKTTPPGEYCYPTPDDCNYNEGLDPPVFIPGDIHAGDFDGDGDQDVIFVADIGDRTFKSLGSDEDKSFWSTIHLLFNDGAGRLAEDYSKYSDSAPPRLPAPYHIEIADFNADGIDDAFIASFGVPILREDNTNFWTAYPHLVLMSDGRTHQPLYLSQSGPEAADFPVLANAFAHDASSGDVDGDGDIDVFMNAVLYFSDGNGNFDIVDLNQKEVVESWGVDRKKVDDTHAHASTIGDYNNDGIDDLVILWSAKATPENQYGARDWSNVLLGPVTKESPVYLDSDSWKTLPEPFYGEENANYNDADSGDINGDGFDDIVIGSTRSNPYYAGRHVQVLVSQGDGTFSDETPTRFADQPRSELDQSLRGIGIGEGVIVLKDVDRDGDLDIVDTQGIYGGENFAIYPRVTLAFNDGTGVFQEVPLDYFPARMRWDYFDKFRGGMSYGPPLIHRSGVVDLDGKGHLDFVSGFQGGPALLVDVDDGEAKNTQIITTNSFISKRDPAGKAR